jgi:hypothetical protein
MRSRWGCRLAVAAAGAAAALAAPAALAGSYLAKHDSASIAIPAGQTRTLTVPYPEALEYAGALYSARVVVLAPAPGAKGAKPALAKVRILAAHSVLGGSEYQARARNGNRAATAAVRLRVTTTTMEPQPDRKRLARAWTGEAAGAGAPATRR